MNTAAIYVRAATDAQGNASEVQLATCEALALAHGYAVAGRFLDVATKTRAGLAALLTDASDYGAVVVTDLDRLSRDAGELQSIMSRLAASGVPVITREGVARAVSV